jgi:hypothetical protein
MHAIDRRAFLRASAHAAVGAAFVPGLAPYAAEQAAADLPTPCPAGAWRKQGIVLEPTEAWEGTSIQNFTSPAEPLEGGAWRIWYSVSASPSGFALARAEGIPGEGMKKVRALCSPWEPGDGPFTLGNLPEKWRPVQVIHIHLRDGRHRIYFWAHGPRILRYLAADSDDGHRYRVVAPFRPVLYHPSDRAAWGVASPDGLLVHANQNKERPPDEPLAISRLISNDATNVYQLPDSTFELYSVGLVRVAKSDPAYVAQDNAAGLLRVIDRYTSADGLHFETRQRIIARDATDPVDQQFYYLAVTRTPQGCVGMLGHYRCQAQTMDLEWCFSRDGVCWERPMRRAWIERGHPPAPDCYGIYAGNQLVQREGRWHLFYTGTNSAHNGKQSCGKPRQVVMYATVDSLCA